MGVRTSVGVPAFRAAASVPTAIPAFTGEGSFGWDGTKSNTNHQGAEDRAPSTYQV